MGTSELTVREFLRFAVRCGSWEWVRQDFAAEFAKLRDGNALTPGGASPTLWRTSSKFVLKLTANGGDAVYKCSFRFKSAAQYWLRLSPSAKEAFNMLRIGALGFPVPELLAVGETRNFRNLKSSFMVTSFIDSLDGRDFCIGEKREDDDPSKMRFCSEHLKLLAKLHNRGFLHHNFTPFNLLYRQDGDVWHSWWIDLATCRRAYAIGLRDISKEIFKLLQYLKLSPEQRRKLVSDYVAAAQIPQGDIDKLCGLIEKLRLKKLKKEQRKAASQAHGKRG